ncbi:hypothetical protein ACFVU2_19780 [Leifsonia sp. NPDC058194]|uniref:hypothetical protein n=1 Tax=Leifsonia sp. NPDC058194 TaxID=3346374 RepID=UPI0036D92D2E
MSTETEAAKTIRTRNEYVREKTISHHDYYAQFVTEATLRHVHNAFSVDTLRDALAQDRHLNSIPITRWDRLAIHELDVDRPWIGLRSSGRFTAAIPFDRAAAAAAGELVSRATLICIIKTAARMLVEQHAHDHTESMALVGQEA